MFGWGGFEGMRLSGKTPDVGSRFYFLYLLIIQRDAVLLLKLCLELNAPQAIEWRRFFFGSRPGLRCRPLRDFALQDLSCRRARKIRIRPNHPAVYLLEIGEFPVSALKYCLRFRAGYQHERSERLRPVFTRHFDDSAGLYSWLSGQRGLKIFRINI